MSFVWVAIGSALGGVARYALTRWTLFFSAELPWGTVLINVLGCFVIGFFGTYTLASGRHATSENIRLFVMVGLCGGFTTFSSFSLQTFDLVRAGAWGRALANVMISVVLCFVSVALGHLAAHHLVARAAVAQTDQEEGLEA
ncbi:MAG: fluoride efflux transporter CrcB [Janthinobacterium lividum]